MSEYVLDWVLDKIELGDVRRSRALAEISWGLVLAGRLSFTDIAAAMLGKATAASKHKRVFRFVNNANVDPADIQRAVSKAVLHEALRRNKALGPITVPVAIDWHTYDNGEICGLRISLITGSRALPLTWYETRLTELKGVQTKMEAQAIQDLAALRPPHVNWLFLLDCGFHAPEVLDALNVAGFFIVRSQVNPLVHPQSSCWLSVRDLPVQISDLVEFGWLTWSSKSPRAVRIVAARMPPAQQRSRRSYPRKSKQTQPGFCPLLTNLPEEEASALEVLQIYARRFEIEHSFRDIKSVTLGLGMEYLHLKNVETYSRVMGVVAIAELVLWLCGAEAERLGLTKKYTSSRPKNGRRVLSLVSLGRLAIGDVRVPIGTLIRRQLVKAILSAARTISSTWRQPTRSRRLHGLAGTKEELRRLRRSCRRRSKHDTKVFEPCHAPAVWRLITSPDEDSRRGSGAKITAA